MELQSLSTAAAAGMHGSKSAGACLYACCLLLLSRMHDTGSEAVGLVTFSIEAEAVAVAGVTLPDYKGTQLLQLMLQGSMKTQSLLPNVLLLKWLLLLLLLLLPHPYAGRPSPGAWRLP
jgi:hypothetical protein